MANKHDSIDTIVELHMFVNSCLINKVRMMKIFENISHKIRRFLFGLKDKIEINFFLFDVPTN